MTGGHVAITKCLFVIIDKYWGKLILTMVLKTCFLKKKTESLQILLTNYLLIKVKVNSVI